MVIDLAVFVGDKSMNQRSLAKAELTELLDALTQTLVVFTNQRGNWSGTTTELLEEINKIAPPAHRALNDWPSNGIRLGIYLGRCASALGEKGIQSRRERGHAKGRIVNLRQKMQLEL